MRLLIATVAVVGATALGVGLMLLVRRGAPDGSHFADGDRAAGVFGVLATGFAVLLDFVVFLAFESYDEARSGAEREALIVAQQVETAQFLPVPAATELAGQLVCYARSVAGVQWARMENGTLGEELNPFASDMFRTIRTVEAVSASEQSAYDRWHEQTSDREEARRDCIHGAVGVIPTPLWIVLLLSGTLIVAFILFFADSGERAIAQAMLMGSVVAGITATLLLLTALIDEELAVSGVHVTPPCDAVGNPT